ncbi:MAG: non-homologous end-joining DNA ligase [Acidobacteriota bacterium]
MGLRLYNKKRNFQQTSEPRGEISKSKHHRFVVQEHHASNLHFDFRLEMGGVLKSWAIRKGPSLDPDVKRLAITTEDHPVSYLKFQGTIPEGSYGAGEQLIWDTGTYEPLTDENPMQGYEDGKLKFILNGEKLGGEFNLIRLTDQVNHWLLMKAKDDYAKSGWQLELILPEKQSKSAIESQSEKSAASKKTAVEKEVATQPGRRLMTVRRAFTAEKLEGNVDLKVGKHIVALTHLDKIYYPDDGITKCVLARYYYEIADTILPYLKDRPMIMKRYPEGINGFSFHQHDVDEVPDYVRTVRLDVAEGHTVDYLICDNPATLLYMTNLGAIERHPWHSRIKHLDNPDYLVFDLDPGTGVEFPMICEVALTTRKVLENLGLEAYAKTSGSRGIHIYVPIKTIYTYEQVAGFAEQVAKLVVKENPELAAVERMLSKRKQQQIYVDYLQNARGKSVVAPYSARPKPGATVSAPLKWEEVSRKKITPQDFTIKNILRRVDKVGDLFEGVLGKPQKLHEAFVKLENLQEVQISRQRNA